MNSSSYHHARRRFYSVSPPTSEAKAVIGLEQDIFIRARPYGILHESQLQFESKITGSPSTGSRLIDQRKFRNDYYLWSIFLDFQRLRYGDDGVRRVWRNMKLRCGNLGVPFQGEQADHLWSAFLSTGTRDTDFMKSICQYEIKKGCQRPNFFFEVVGGLLKNENLEAHVFASMLKRRRGIETDDILLVFHEACKSIGNSALRHFCKVYDCFPGIKIYDDVVPHLCARECLSDAWLMHRHLLSRRDLPATFESIRPLVEDIGANNLNLGPFLHKLEASNVFFSAQAFRLYTQERARYMGLSTGNLNIVSSKTFGIRCQGLSDEFAARAFATRSLSFELVLNGLRFLGLTTVGPLSVRQIALSAGGVNPLAERLAKLSELEIDFGSSVYVQVVRNLTTRGAAVLLDAVLNSDQHPDVFEDLDLQKKLLVSYYERRDWASMDRTIAVLTRGELDTRAQGLAKDLWLQAALAARDWDGVQSHLADLISNGSPISRSSIQAMYRSSMPSRKQGVQLLRQEINNTQRLISIWQEVLKSGNLIPLSLWREPTRQLGMAGRFVDLRSLVLWLASWYGKQSEAQPAQLMTTRPVTDLHLLFEPWLQAAIVTWGFIRPVEKIGTISSELDAEQMEWHLQTRKYPWMRGIELLRILHDEHGVPIDMPTIRRACISRMRQLYAPVGSSKLPNNRRHKTRNTISLSDCMRTLDQAWGSVVFPYPELIRARVLSTRLFPHQHDRLSLQSVRKRSSETKLADAAAEASDLEHEKEDAAEEVVVYRDIFNGDRGRL